MSITGVIREHRCVSSLTNILISSASLMFSFIKIPGPCPQKSAGLALKISLWTWHLMMPYVSTKITFSSNHLGITVSSRESISENEKESRIQILERPAGTAYLPAYPFSPGLDKAKLEPAMGFLISREPRCVPLLLPPSHMPCLWKI